MRGRRATIVRGVVLALAVAPLGVAACGDDGEETASPAMGFDSAYCVTARDWAVHELSGDGDAQYARGGPAALEKWFNAQGAHLKASARQAPSAIHGAAGVNERAIRTVQTPVLENYGYDPERIASEGSPAPSPPPV